MDIKKLLHNFVFAGATYYTAISTGFILVAQMLTEGESVKLLETAQFLKILLFSFMMALGYALYRTDYFGRIAARCLHAGCYLLGFLLFAVLAGVDFVGAIVGTLIFAVVYIMCTLILGMILQLGGKTKKAKDEKKAEASAAKKKEAYQSQFGTKK